MNHETYDEMVERLVKVQADARALAFALTNQDPSAQAEVAKEAGRIQDELAQIAQVLVGLEWPS